jgi:hypothetical protein
MSGTQASVSALQSFGKLDISGHHNVVHQGIHLEASRKEHSFTVVFRQALTWCIDPKTGYFLVPRSPNRLFTGRDEVLRKLSASVHTGHKEVDQKLRITITGLGGLGKSELCLHLIERLRGRY